MKLRRFTRAGVERFHRCLDTVGDAGFDSSRSALLEDPSITEALIGDVDLTDERLRSRMDAGRYLHEVAGQQRVEDVGRDVGLWSWLACLAFENICGRSADGSWDPGARPRWVLDATDYKRYYRHLLAGPYYIYREHRDDPGRALAVLCGPVGRMGDIVEQLASRQELVTNRGVMQVATMLYVEGPTGEQKRGAGGKGRGSPRRLVSVLQQLDLTWDLFELTGAEIMDMLPQEFDRFRP